MDKLQLAQIAPLVIVMIAVAIYYLVAKRKPRTAEAMLFKSIIHRGCGTCGSNFDITPSEEHRSIDVVRCQKCNRRYHVDMSLQYAWDINE